MTYRTSDRRAPRWRDPTRRGQPHAVTNIGDRDVRDVYREDKYRGAGQQPLALDELKTADELP